MSDLFKGLTIAVAGSFGRIYTHWAIQELVEKHGGTWSSRICDGVTHVLATTSELTHMSNRVRLAVATRSCKAIVQLSWVLESIVEGKILPEAKYILVDVTHRSPLVIMSAFHSRLNGICLAPQAITGMIETHIVYADIPMAKFEASDGTNINDYVHIQILQPKVVNEETNSKFAVWEAWGRVSTKTTKGCRSTRLIKDVTLKTALNKAHSLWQKYEEFEGYEFVKRDYSEVRNHNCAAFTKLLHEISPETPTPDVPDQPPQVDGAMKQANLPFGTLHRDVFAEANKILDKISRAIASRAAESTKNNENEARSSAEIETPGHRGNSDEEICKSIYKYYSILPRKSIGALSTKPSTWTVKAIKTEKTTLRTLQDYSRHSCQEQLGALSMEELDTVQKDTQEYREIAQYFDNTLYKWEAWKGKIIEVFRIVRRNEDAVWSASQWTPERMGRHDNRRLVWHGSKAENIASILRRGLRLTRMPDIYFSDTAGKSMNYTRYRLQMSSKPKFLLLCEVQLGSAAAAHHRLIGGTDFEWKDAEDVADLLKGVRMPNTNLALCPKEFKNSEWLVKDPGQIRHRYLVMIQ